MRRQSFSSSQSSGSGGAGEPLIVVEESTQGEEEEEAEKRQSESPPRCSLDPDSPSLNPYLLSPWRETRKHSLPTPQCTSGITASQVRRLSERGGEGSGPSPREAAFLATLSQSSPPQPGGRRHSVVTISRVPATLFGRNRRESIAAFPMGGVSRVLGGRRDSTGQPSGPPSNSGSMHNLQLDIMDDIAEIKAARKVRLKMWKTPSHERVCEVQPLEGNGSAGGVAQRYTQNQQRRYSDFAVTTLPTVPSGVATNRRRASEMPPPIPPRSGMPPVLGAGAGGGAPAASGIVCTNTDLISILSSLTSSATEIDRCGAEDEKDSKQPAVAVAAAAAATTAANAPAPSASSSTSVKTIEQKRNRLKSSRSNSFDVSILHGCGTESKQSNAGLASGACGKNNSTASIISPSSWFAKRHQPMSKKQQQQQRNGGPSADSPSTSLGFKFEKSRVVKAVKDSLAAKTSPTKDETRHKVVWDGSSGTKVDAQLLGNAIEEFLRSGASGSGEASEMPQESNGGRVAAIPGKPAASGRASANSSGKVSSSTSSWFGSGPGGAHATSQSGPSTAGPQPGKDEQQTDSCEPSICSSLKDLFVK